MHPRLRAYMRPEKNERSVCAYFRSFSDLLRAPRLRRVPMERQIMFARSVAIESDLSAELVGLKGERHKPSYRFRAPLGAGGLPTCN